ncbi:MAG: flippase [Patescibacteria group bacterium]
MNAINRLKELLFNNRGARQTVVKNMFWLTFSQTISRLIRAIIIIYAARVLGAAEYGIFSYALGLAGFFTIFADIGIGQILTREVSQKPERASSYFATSLWLKVSLLVGTSLLIIFAAPHFSKLESATALLPFVALLVIFDNLREFGNAFFRAKEKMEYEAFVTVLMNLAITALGFVALSISATARSVTIAYVGSAGAGFLAAVYILREEFMNAIRNFDWRLIQPTMHSAWPIAILGLLGTFMLNVDIIMLGWMRTAAEIGYYASGQKVAQVLYTISAIISSALFPAISRAVGRGDRGQVTLLMERGMAALFLIAIPLAVGGIVLGKSIIEFLYSAEYIPGTLSFQILMMTMLVVFPGAFAGNLVLAYDKQKKIAVYAAMASVGNIVFNVLFIPLFGIAGAALATLLVQAMNNCLVWNMIKGINPFYTLRNIKKAFIASLLMGVVAFSLDRLGIHVLAAIGISGAAYFVFLFLFKERIVEEIKSMMKAARA